MDLKEREIAKKEAWNVLHDPEADVYKKAWYAVHKLIDAYYWGARKTLDKAKSPFRRRVHGKRFCRGYELGIDVYTRHWLWANGDRILPPDVLDVIRSVWGYSAEEHKLLPKGQTRYVDTSPTKWKLRNNSFGADELQVHRDAAEMLGRHRALHDAMGAEAELARMLIRVERAEAERDELRQHKDDADRYAFAKTLEGQAVTAEVFRNRGAAELDQALDDAMALWPMILRQG